METARRYSQNQDLIGVPQEARQADGKSGIAGIIKYQEFIWTGESGVADRQSTKRVESTDHYFMLYHDV